MTIQILIQTDVYTEKVSHVSSSWIFHIFFKWHKNEYCQRIVATDSDALNFNPQHFVLMLIYCGFFCGGAKLSTRNGDCNQITGSLPWTWQRNNKCCNLPPNGDVIANQLVTSTHMPKVITRTHAFITQRASGIFYSIAHFGFVKLFDTSMHHPYVCAHTHTLYVYIYTYMHACMYVYTRIFFP